MKRKPPLTVEGVKAALKILAKTEGAMLKGPLYLRVDADAARDTRFPSTSRGKLPRRP